MTNRGNAQTEDDPAMRRPSHAFRLALLIPALLLFGLQARSEAVSPGAHFAVRPQVLNPDLPAFTATVAGLGNGVDLMRNGGGFEPLNFRTMLQATQDSPDQVIAPPATLTQWDSWPEGAFDGAEVEVLRIVDGHIKSVREDRIAAGGFRASGWVGALPGGQVLAAGQTRFLTSWDGYNRLGVPWYYTVRAIDGGGRVSDAAPAVSVVAPQKPGKIEGAAPGLVQGQLSGGETTSLAAPSNLRAELTPEQTLALSWDPVPGAQGYMVYRAYVPPERFRGYGIQLEGRGEPVRAGDMVLLRKKFMMPSRAEVATNRVWSAYAAESGFGVPLVSGMPGDTPDGPQMRLVPHPADTPVAEPGETYLEVDLKGRQTATLGLFNHSGLSQYYYPILDPARTYRFDVWLRGDGVVSATFQINGPVKALFASPPVIRPGREWRRYTIDFRPAATVETQQVGRMELVLSGKGKVDVDNFRLYRADAPFMALLPEDKAALRASGMGMLRSHMFIKTGTRTYSLDQLTNPAGVNPVGEGTSLPQFLNINADAGMEPWLQVEPHLTRAEWLGLAEYLAAPFDPAVDDPKALPWAAKRAAQGRAAPWTEAFGQIYFEIGNETWNTLFRPWVFPEMPDGGSLLPWRKASTGEVYGLYQEYVLSILRESPWWDRLAPHLVPVIGGWLINDYGFDALRRSPSSRVVTVADYIGGWDAGEGVVSRKPEGYASVMAFTPQTTVGRATAAQETLRKKAAPGGVILGTYEAGPGYALNGLNGDTVTPEQREEQEKVMKSAAAGAATLDNFLTRAQAGDRVQNFFMFARGGEWSSHARWDRGGQAYPSWDWLALFNKVGRGDVLEVDTLAVPRRDLPKMGWRPEMAGAPMAAAYAARKGDRLTVTVISRQVTEGPLPVRVDLPISGAKSLTRYHATGSYTSENTREEQTRLQSETLPVPADPGRLDIPALAPASAEIFVYEGVTDAP